MKRILMVLVLLLTVSLAGSVPAVLADEVTTQTAPRPGGRTQDGVANFYGPAGDPDGMGTGNGVVDPPAEIAPAGLTDGNAVAADGPQSDQYLQLLLSLAQLLVH